MPELPDVTIYLECLEPRIVGRPLERIRLKKPFLLRSVEPPLSAAEGRTVVGLRRLGKRLVWELEEKLFLVIHLMIAGRLRWRDRGAGLPGRRGLCAYDFPTGTLILTEAGSKRRAWMRLVEGEESLAALDPGGMEVSQLSLDRFGEVLKRENRTLKRALTDPRFLSGIGNAYSDEILHRARLSPFKRTHDLDDATIGQLLEATRTVLDEWTDRLRAQVGDGFPEKVTAFHHDMAVHGKYRQPCPVCEAPILRIRYAERECNYCPGCQTEGRILRDRSLSRLLKKDWPRTLDELEQLP